MALWGCAADASGLPAEQLSSAATINDPLEWLNRPIFYADAGIDIAVLQPATRLYVQAVPSKLRTGLHNVLTNLKAPYIAANDVLQALPCSAAQTVTRFAINSTVGLGGVFDVAARVPIAAHDNDLTTTLQAYGVPSGPYLVLPLLGPSDVRDGSAKAAEFFVDPVDLAAAHYFSAAAVWGRFAGDVLDGAAAVTADDQQAIRNSNDPYAALRDDYLRTRSQRQAVPSC